MTERICLEKVNGWSIWSCYGDHLAITLLTQESAIQHPWHHYVSDLMDTAWARGLTISHTALSSPLKLFPTFNQNPCPFILLSWLLWQYRPDLHQLYRSLPVSCNDGPGPPFTHIPSVQFPAPLHMNNSQEKASTGLLPGKRAGDLLSYHRFW